MWPRGAGTCFLAPSAPELVLGGCWHRARPVAGAAPGWRRSGSRGAPQHLPGSAQHLPIPHHRRGNTRRLLRGKFGRFAQIFTAPVSCLGRLSPEGSAGRRQQGTGSSRNQLLSAQTCGLQRVRSAPVSLCRASTHGLLKALYLLRCPAGFKGRARCGLQHSLCLCAREVKAAHTLLTGFGLPPPLPDPELPPRGIDPWSLSPEKGLSQVRRARPCGVRGALEPQIPLGVLQPPARLSGGLHPITDSAGPRFRRALPLEQASCAVAAGARRDLPLASHPRPCRLSQELSLPVWWLQRAL